MGFMDQIQQKVLGSLSQSNPKVAGAISDLLSKEGGIDGLIKKFQSGGLKETCQSWVSKGENKPITPDQITQALGSETVQNLATKSGVDKKVLASQLSEFLPKFIDKITPDGKLPNRV